MPQKRGLGRGLDALLSSTKPDSQPTTHSNHTTSLLTRQLHPGRYQPRQQFDEEKLRELADSIHAQGLIQPIVVRAVEDQGYEIIAGERRWRAAQLAGITEVPVIIKNINDQTAMAVALIENMQRDDLKPLEEASAIQRLLQECNLTHQQVAQAIGKSRASVSNLLRLLDLHSEVRTLLAQGDLDMGHARALLGLPEEEQHAAAMQVVQKGLTVRATEALVRQQLDVAQMPSASELESAETSPAADYHAQLERLTSQLGAPVTLQSGRKNKNKGKLVIQYNNLEQLHYILSQIQQ